MIKNVHGHAVASLGTAIVAGRYLPGAPMPPEPQLGEALGVSRTVVREAIKSLVAKGMVSTGPKVGTRVLPPESWNWFDADLVGWQSQVGLTREFLRDLQELRRLVEPAAVRMAAERATVADLQHLEAAYEGMRHAVVEGGDYVRHDLAFHQGLLRAAHNRMIVQMSKALGPLLRTSFEISTARTGGARDSLPLHRAVLDAVIARKPARAEKAALVLIDGARDDIEVVLASRRRLPKLDAPPRLLRGQ
ncbi:FadR/GntR family transcriptional regulator [Ramlibacter sp. Leaf400]|uniref:FadR/GntR family transcriptional regulator n=1 Tax=Ramlibacter sp. Leaf400 TaxID=1736365 RepID=UPI0007008B05|nr:FadR/GntR family transcriptional regulator [Ramlibacter sp. Leaf400]KQT11386.1 GntR family transcriptional regulator [Ramlibacter sp. Leaf400]